MPVVDIHLRQKKHTVSCGKGQEQHVTQLGNALNDRLANLAATLGNTADYTLLVMAALMMEDELASLNTKINEQSTAKAQDTKTNDVENEQLTHTMQSATEHIERLAKLLDNV